MAGNRIVLKTGSEFRKLCRVWFGKDGSYFVSVPYHTARTAFLFKVTNDYSMSFNEMRAVAKSDWLEDASLDDDDNCLKLSHHRSGMCHFSGAGIVSGVDANGTFKGIGIDARPLDIAGEGPDFAVCVYGISALEPISAPKKGDFVIDFDRLVEPAKPSPSPPDSDLLPERAAIRVEGFHFVPDRRMFLVNEQDGSSSISIVHPTNVVYKLFAAIPERNCEYLGFLGLGFSRVFMMSESETGFSISGPAGRVRKDELGRNVADSIGCIYPRPNSVEFERSLNYQPPAAESGPN